MRALRIEGQAVVHATSHYVDGHKYVHTACGIINQVVAREHNNERATARLVHEPVDCMTCLVNIAREQDTPDFLTNPCAEIVINPRY